ncbi:bacterio-opsin activator domain-containing protein [Halobellus sp. GM3]|uniref:bacterio-opsin activator domain-containing protein n=1 Tax=Halobellus sp. GM3 TaxID=3458410 RepID=UPI00403DAF96
MSENGQSGRSEPTEIEFSLRGGSHPFVEVSEREGCTFELAEMLPRSNGRYAEFFTVTGVEPARIAALDAENRDVEITLLTAGDDSGLFEFLVADDCPALSLAELGALPRTVRGSDGDGRIVAEVPPNDDAAAVVDAFLDAHPDAELTAKRELEAISSFAGRSAVERLLRAHLTDRQREVLETAFESGYYDWPRTCTGEEVAERLDITSATFSEHIHTAERKLFAVMFDGRR